MICAILNVHIICWLIINVWLRIVWYSMAEFLCLAQNTDMVDIDLQCMFCGVDWAASHAYFVRVIKHFVADFETQPGYLPAMEMHGSLKMLLDTLMDKQALSSWQIYEEKNDSVVVKIRFAARHCNATVTGATTSEDKIIAYKRKSPAQIRRDNARSKQHYEKRVTRSQTVRTDNDIVPQDISEPEIGRTNDNDFLSDTLNPGLVSPMPCAAEPTSVLDPLVSPFTPTGLCWTSSDPAPTGVEDEVLPAPSVSSASCQDVESISLDSVSSEPCSQESDTDDDDVGVYPSLHSDAGVVHNDRNTTRLYIDGSAVVTKVGLGNGKPGCQNYSCMYGGGRSRDDINHIYKCLKCEGPHTSSICAKCMLNGGCCEPGHDNWELIT